MKQFCCFTVLDHGYIRCFSGDVDDEVKKLMHDAVRALFTSSMCDSVVKKSNPADDQKALGDFIKRNVETQHSMIRLFNQLSELGWDFHGLNKLNDYHYVFFVRKISG